MAATVLENSLNRCWVSSRSPANPSSIATSLDSRSSGRKPRRIAHHNISATSGNTSNAGLAPSIIQAAKPDAKVLVLQNGLDVEDSLRELLPESLHLLGGLGLLALLRAQAVAYSLAPLAGANGALAVHCTLVAGSGEPPWSSCTVNVTGAPATPLAGFGVTAVITTGRAVTVTLKV